MAALRRIALFLATTTCAVWATSLGYEQRQAFKLWQEQHLHERSVNSHLVGRQQINVTCVSAIPVEGTAERLNNLIQSGGEGYTLSLCPNTTYTLTAPLQFTNKNQEISTLGYPIGDERAVLLVNGSTATDGTGHTVAILGSCGLCAGVAIRHIQIDGNRQGAAPIAGGGNIELGGPGGGQLIEFVRSYEPRGWTCAHIAEGSLDCTNATVRYNDIGPCGSDHPGHWADGISLACIDSKVHDNWIVDPTDGGIVIFQSPGSLIENNTIWIENNTCLGGINLVDYDPFAGNYTGTVVRNNTVVGGYANVDPTVNSQFSNNTENAIIKIGIAVGLRVWFGTKWGDATAYGASVIGNKVSGAFGFGIAVSGVSSFTVAENTLLGNASFIGTRGPNCTEADILPPAVAFVVDPTAISATTILGTFKAHGMRALLCVTPPRGGGNVWPVGTWPTASPALDTVTSITAPTTSALASDWCLAGEANWDCIKRFIYSLVKVKVDIVAERRM